MDLGLKDKVIVVAGASKGLGYAVARACAQEGARLVIGSRSEEAIGNAARQLGADTGCEVAAVSFDATDADSISGFCEVAVDHFGGIDGLAVNAGGPPAGMFDDFDDDAWQDAFELTLLSAVRMIRAALPALRDGGGSVVTLTSSSVREPIDTLLLSNVMRAGVAGLAKSLSRYLAPDAIRVNNLVPGVIGTDRITSLQKSRAKMAKTTVKKIHEGMVSRIPMGRFGDPDEFGRAGAFLLSDAASYITGSTLVVDGGAMRSL